MFSHWLRTADYGWCHSCHKPSSARGTDWFGDD